MKNGTVKAVAAVMVVLMMGTLAACKKDPVSAGTTTEEASTRSAWLDETMANETTIITDENGETKTYSVGKNADGTTSLYEAVTDVAGKAVKSEDGKAVTKPYVPTTQATTAPKETEPTNAPTTSPKPTKPPVPPTKPPVQPTKPPVKPTNPPVQPTNPPVQPTNPPSSGIVYTPELKEAIKQELAAYARQCGWKMVYTDDMGDRQGDEYDFKADNYDRRMSIAKGYIRELVAVDRYPEKYINIQWSEARPNSLYIYFA